MKPEAQRDRVRYRSRRQALRDNRRLLPMRSSAAVAVSLSKPLRDGNCAHQLAIYLANDPPRPPKERRSINPSTSARARCGLRSAYARSKTIASSGGCGLIESLSPVHGSQSNSSIGSHLKVGISSEASQRGNRSGLILLSWYRGSWRHAPPIRYPTRTFRQAVKTWSPNVLFK
jgi:hypothetical protein